eukprot:Skav203221  [mRNA]  locus=scaffold2292:200777:207086:+ [translate_table: standard]
MSPREGPGSSAEEDLLWSEVLSGVLDEAPAPPSRGSAAPPSRGSLAPPSRGRAATASRGGAGASSPSRSSGGGLSPKVSEWSRPLVVERRFCKHIRRQYTVHLAADLLKGESFGALRRRGYGSKLQKIARRRGLPAA